MISTTFVFWWQAEQALQEHSLDYGVIVHLKNLPFWSIWQDPEDADICDTMWFQWEYWKLWHAKNWTKASGPTL